MAWTAGASDSANDGGDSDSSRAEDRAGASSAYGRILDPDTLDAIEQAEKVESQSWAEGWDVTIHGAASAACPEGLEGCRGVTRGFDPLDRSFVVRVSGREELLRLPPENLTFPWSGAGAAAGPPGAAGPAGPAGGGAPHDGHQPGTAVCGADSALKIVRELFAPGSRFEGTIAIPGTPEHVEHVSKDGRAHYTLEVVEESMDEFGRPTLLIRHAAHDDEQACHLHIRATAAEPGAGALAEVHVAYQDGETICDGAVSFAGMGRGRCKVRGSVRQYVYGEEGFYENSTELTHTFELERSTTCAVEAVQARRIEEARRCRLRALCAWLKAARWDQATITGLRELPWEDIVLRDAARHCEEQCAALRGRSESLDALVFRSAPDKRAELSRLQKAGLHRAACHAANDAALLQLKTLLHVSLPGLQREDLRRAFEHAFYKTQHRLSRSYAQFDRALRSAHGRLPQDVLASWLRDRADDGTDCAVCLLPLSEGGRKTSTELPCGHCFHPECVSHWLHHHTTCPNCRCEHAPKDGVDASQNPGEAGPRQQDD